MKLNILVAVLALSATALAQTGGGILPTLLPPPTSTTAATSTTDTTSATTPTSDTTSSQPTTSSVPSTTSTPTSSSAPSSSAPPSSSTSSVAPTSNSSQSSIQTSTSVVITSAQTTASTSSTPTSTAPPSGGSSSNTGVIAGATVGGIVGLALIAGILTWINRKGGCTRRRQRDTDFEDYGMDDNDFPARPMASASAAAAAAGAGAMTSPRQQEPTLPQFGGYDDQYNNGARRFVPSYQPQLQQHPDYYGGQQQGGQYYNYPGSDQAFSDTTYNDPNYYGAAGAGYYDSKTSGGGDAHKPDDAVENKPHEKL